MAKYKWQESQNSSEKVSFIEKKYDLPHTIAQVVANRVAEIEDVETYLSPQLKHMLSPWGLFGLKDAAHAIAQAILDQKKILIHGDFDADGITSSALLMFFFKALHAQSVVYIPNRLQEGHGLSLRALEKAKQEQCHMVITCDCGSSNKNEIEMFQAAGIDVIITDHHQAGDSVEANCIIVNPQLSDNKKYQDLAGVGVAFMLAVGVRSVLREKNFFLNFTEPNLKKLLDIVALGTIADMAKLTGLNRVFVKEGLNLLAFSEKPGIAAMRNSAGIVPTEKVSSEDFGFKLAPRINAAARLGKADLALNTLLAEDMFLAAQQASSLELLNTQRKSMQKEILSKAKHMARMLISQGQKCIVLSSKDFHPGINGLVAQQLAQDFAVPAIVFFEEGNIMKGSARSFGTFNLMELFNHVSEHMLQFGGHHQAGGGSVASDKFLDFKNACFSFMREYQGLNQVIKYYDGELSSDAVNFDFIKTLNALGPFGMGHEEPVFKFSLRPIDVRCLGNTHLKFSVACQNGAILDCIGFGFWDAYEAKQNPKVIDIVARPEINTWQGQEKIQLRMIDLL